MSKSTIPADNGPYRDGKATFGLGSFLMADGMFFALDGDTENDDQQSDLATHLLAAPSAQHRV
jgi:hypothetical protein